MVNDNGDNDIGDYEDKSFDQ